MTTPTDQPRPSEPAFPAAQGTTAGASSSAVPPTAPGSFVARGIALGAVAVAFGAIFGYSAKPDAGEARFIDFDSALAPGTVLTSGWSGFEELPDGDTYVWCANENCALQVHLGYENDRILRVRLWPFRYLDAPPQTVTVFVNGTSVGTSPLVDDVASILSFPVGRALWRASANDVRFQFAYAVEPKSKYPDSDDPRTLAAAFDWLEIATPARRAPRR